MKKKLWAAVAITALCAAFTLPAFAQGSAESSVRGNLSGIVVDSSGAVVTGAKVTISGPTGTKSDTTNQDGQFIFPLLSPGFYGLKVEKGSFKTADVKGVEVVTGKTSNVRVGLVAGQQTEIVEVSASAITVDTTSTAVAANLTDTFYQSVPVARGVTGLFYASPGVVNGGIAGGSANPSIGGSSSLENLYVADGVSITDGAFGGIGTFSRVYGSLSTGINLSFVKEVQVKTGGFEAQYGKSDGGIVQIVTKSGGKDFHGAIGGFFAPQEFEATRKQSDDFHRFNLQGKNLHEGNMDFDAEVGGYVPKFRDRLFFFGSYNPTWNTVYAQHAQFVAPMDAGTGGLGSTAPVSLGNTDLKNTVNNYSSKLTWKLNDKNQLEASLFGDPTSTNTSSFYELQNSSPTVDDKLNFGTRNFVVSYNGTMTPSWLVNASFTWGHNHVTDTPVSPSTYQIIDTIQSLPCDIENTIATLIPCSSVDAPMRGNFYRQGYGFLENTKGDDYGLSLDTSKSFHFLGQHSVTLGYRRDRSHYDGVRTRTGARYDVPDCNTDGSACGAALYGSGAPSIAGATSDATFSLFQARNTAGCTLCPLLYVPGFSAPVPVYLKQTRGEYGNPAFKTNSTYHALFMEDTWSPNKFLTINAGLRWEQEQQNGTSAHYTFTDNWSPRVGIAIDPWGNRKSKIFVNFARYTQPLPLDVAIRSLSAELDLTSMRFAPDHDASNNVIVNPDGTINVIPDAAHLLNKAAGGTGGTPFISGQSLTAFAPGTRLQYTDEYVVGFEHEFGDSGVIFSARYQDRRIKRIIEDMASVTPECGQAGCSAQQIYVIANPSASLDMFTNYNELTWNSANPVPASCDPVDQFVGPGAVVDANGNAVSAPNGDDSFCLTNSATAGLQIPDGQADGFANPVRIYKSMEFEVNKSFSKNWQLRANYRIAKLFGNYEGLARNDNGQTDPGISSLFDFTQGNFGLLAGQFTPGVLNTDVRHNANGFVSYTFGNRMMKGLTMGTSVHFQTGTPITPLLAHPVYLNGGESPDGIRGSGGRTPNMGQVDFHADYPIRLTERTKIRLAADLFNVTNQRTQLRVDQLEQQQAGIRNADFLKPTSSTVPAVQQNAAFQRPFYARFGVRFEF